MLHLNRLNLLGIFFILFAIFLFVTDYLDKIMLILTYPFLEGSSEGKSVLFLMIMGSILLIYPLFNFNGKIMKKLVTINPIFKASGRKYLKIAILLILFVYIVGMILEIWIRVKFGVSIFTTFASLSPNVTTTSITHSHILKSASGSFISYFGIWVPSHIYTGSSLSHFVSPVAFLIFIALPIIYLTGLISLNDRRNGNKLILIFALTMSFIGILDGGLFSTPALIGLSGLLGIYALKEPFSPRQLITPSIIIIILILVRFSLGILGTNTDFYEITVIEPAKEIDLRGYDVLSIEKRADRTIIRVSTKMNENQFLNQMINVLDGKCSGFFVTWNFYSFF